MEETLLFPSPNWFQVSGLAVSKDGWLAYGGPCKSLCVLEPISQNKCVLVGKQSYRAHVVNWSHCEKVTSVDFSLEWPDKKFILSGSADGSVKQWNMVAVVNNFKIKATLSHGTHSKEKEDVVGVGYSNETFAITVGGYGNVVKWDLNSNVVKSYSNFLKNFKPTCMACSPHLQLHVGIGTKQGVIFVLDLNDSGKIIYKVRGQDDEVLNLSWCPKYEVEVKKSLVDLEKGESLSQRLERIRNEPEPEHDVKKMLQNSGVIKTLPDDSFDNTEIVQEDDMFDIYKDCEVHEFGHTKYEPEEILVKIKEDKETKDDYLEECMKLKEEILKKKNQSQNTIQDLVEALDKAHVSKSTENELERKICENETKEIKDVGNASSQAAAKSNTETTENKVLTNSIESGTHIHKHLLATIGKYGAVRVWSKAGKLVGSCAAFNVPKNQKIKYTACTTLLWHRPDMLLIVDGKSQLLESNPLEIDCKNKLKWRIIHTLFKRGLFCIVSTAPRVQTGTESEDWVVWSAAQDRSLACYSMKERRVVSWHNTCGGFPYCVQVCPYDARRIAISVGDGAVRVWEADTLTSDDMALTSGHITSYWQNVLGKVLIIAWHPTKENLLAFATAESRVGLIDTSGKTEKPAKVLVPVLQGGIYGLCWGDGFELFACGGGKLVVYQAKDTESVPESIKVSLDGQDLGVCSVQRSEFGLLCGSTTGAVALLSSTKPYNLITATYVFSKMIHSVECHPQQTSHSNEESPYKNLIAVSSMDKLNNIVILQLEEKDGIKQLKAWKNLSGHKGVVLQLMWNPHREMLLLSTSQDWTVRVWDAVKGTCLSIFAGHSGQTVGAAWGAYPQLDALVLSGGADCCLRLWRYTDHPPQHYDELKHEVALKKEKKKTNRKKDEKVEEEEQEKKDPPNLEAEEQVASNIDNRRTKGSKRFILPISNTQMNSNALVGAKKLLEKYLKQKCAENKSSANGLAEKESIVVNGVSNKLIKKDESVQENGVPNEAHEENGATNTEPVAQEDTSTAKVKKHKEIGYDFIKLFGGINDINELLDKEMERQLATGNWESWTMQCIFRGHIDTMMKYASERDLICPHLLSIAPCVSFKYWKDCTQLYLAQIERLVAKGEEDKLYESRQFGGAVFRRAAALLAVQDARGAIAALSAAHLYKEAYLLARIRYMDSIAEETLRQWAHHCVFCGTLPLAAACFIALGDLSQAATILSKSSDQECLSLAADLAKVVGQNTLAGHLVEKKEYIKNKGSLHQTEEILEQLPSRIELLMKENKANVNEATEETYEKEVSEAAHGKEKSEASAKE